MQHYLALIVVIQTQAINYALTIKWTKLIRIQMSSTPLSNWDHVKIIVYLSMVTTVREMDQILYLSHESIGFYAYILGLQARLHGIKLSSSIWMIFVADFSNQNGLTTRFSTNTIGICKILMLFSKSSTTVQIMSCMGQYWFQGLFIWYICQI